MIAVRNKSGRGLRGPAGMAAVIAMAVLLTACGSNDGDGQSGANGGKETLRWSANTINPNQTVLFAAMGTKAFDKYDLKVEFVPAQSSAAAITTDSTDLIVGRLSDPLALVNEGKSMKVLASSGVNSPVGVIANKDIASIDAIAAMGSDCRTATLPNGGVYLWVRFFMEKYGLKCKVDTVADYKTTIDATVSGRFDFTIQTAATGGAVVGSGNAKWLLDPTDPTVSAANRPDFSIISGAIATTAEYAESDGEQLKDFFAALADTEKWMHTATNEEIAQAVKDSGVEYYKPQSIEEIVGGLTSSGAFDNVFQTVGGEVEPIPQELWDEQIEISKDLGIDIDKDDPKFSYAEAYDGSFIGQ